MDDDLIVNGIAEVIQRVYGDATQTVLDRHAAREIWRYLTEHGVVTSRFVAAVVAAAGGSVTVPENVLEDPCDELWSTIDQLEGGLILRVRRSRADHVEATVADRLSPEHVEARLEQLLHDAEPPQTPDAAREGLRPPRPA